MATERRRAPLATLRRLGQGAIVLALAVVSPVAAWNAYALTSGGAWGWAVVLFLSHAAAVYALCAGVALLGPCDSTAVGWTAGWGWLIGGNLAIVPLGLASPLYALGALLIIGAGVVVLLAGIRGAERGPLLRERRRRRGQCQACGYNMAGVPSENPCPECGAVGGAGPGV